MPVRKVAAVLVAVLALLALSFASAPTALAVPAVTGSFKVSEIGTNNKIVMGPDGNMWLTVNGGGKDVAKITPDGTVEEFELEGVAVPTGIATSSDGRLWVTLEANVVGFLPSDPKGTSKGIEIAEVKPGASIIQGPEGEMWVATKDNLVHFPLSNPAEFKVVPFPGLEPKDMDVSGSQLVIAEGGTARLVVYPPGGEAIGIGLLGETSTSQGVAAGPGGQIAFSKSDKDEGLGLVTPPAGPTAVLMEGDPFGVALGSDGAYWFAMSFAHNVQRLTPEGVATPLNGFPEAESPGFFPRQIAPGPDNTMWVTMEVPGKERWEVARISGLEPPTKPGTEDKKPTATAPETKIGKGPKGKVTTRRKRAKVKFTFSSTTAGVTFECALVKVAKKGKKQPKPVFKGCKSPHKLKLKPARYRFQVRAVNAGVADPTPATRSFRVVRLPKKK